MGAFGEKLRKQREQRGLALEAISNITKISIRMLRALEDEHFDQLPGGVFNKGFVRAYARQIGLNEEETLNDYLDALRESQIQAQRILPDFRAPGTKSSPSTAHKAQAQVRPEGDLLAIDLAKRDGGNGGRAPEPTNRRKGDRRKRVEQPSGNHEDAGESQDISPSPSFITLAENSSAQAANEPAASSRFARNTLAAVVLLLTIGFAIWNVRRHRESAIKAAVSSEPSASPGSAQPPARVVPAASAPSPKVNPVSPAPRATTKLSGGVTSGTAPSTPAPASTTKPPAKPSANLAPTETLVKAPSPAVATPAAANPISFTLRIRAEKTTWVLITADGKPVAHETLIAPAYTSVRASREIVVRAGNAAGVSFVLNGKEIPASGSDGEVKTYIFDATQVRAVSQSQPAGPNR